MSRLLQVPVVSVAMPVDPSCEYAGLPHFVHFGDAISFVGGINMPKLVQCFDRRAGSLRMKPVWRSNQCWLFLRHAATSLAQQAKVNNDTVVFIRQSRQPRQHGRVAPRVV